MTRKEEVLDLITQLETKLKGLKQELADKIFYANVVKKLRTYVQESDIAPVKITEETQVAADVSAPVNTDTLSLADRSVFEETSAKLSQALVEWESVRTAISDAIRATDKRVTNVSVPARPNELMYNTFDSSQATALMIASTNSDAYVITRSEKGLVTATSAKYWKSTTSVS